MIVNITCRQLGLCGIDYMGRFLVIYNKYKALALLLKSGPDISVNLWSQPQSYDYLNADNVTSCSICTAQLLLILPIAAKIKRCSVTQAWNKIQLGLCPLWSPELTPADCYLQKHVIFDVQSTVYLKNLHVRQAVAFDSKGCNNTSAQNFKMQRNSLHHRVRLLLCIQTV